MVNLNILDHDPPEPPEPEYPPRKVGDRVAIYIDPLHRTSLEGYANLVKEMKPVNADGFSFWLIHFDIDEPDEHYHRWINENE